ncbi:MAG: dethiobiotin synthase [Pseudomonadota bacterium]|nr:dethiobiotin synthase [Pseudomonadota bacterium]
MSAYFVTSCGTERGKTHVAESLIKEWLLEGLSVDVLKPIVSGFEINTLVDSDTYRLLSAIREEVCQESIERISPWRFSAPLSPDIAAAMEGRSVPVDEVISYCRIKIQQRTTDILLIEGIGGVMVPLNGNRTVRDLIAGVGVPAILVVGSYLGSLSHALTAFEALKIRNIAVDRIVVNETTPTNISVNETRAVLSRFVGNVPITTMSFSSKVQ